MNLYKGVLMHLTHLIAALICIPLAHAAAQPDDRVAWLKEHATPIRTLDMYSNDFTDLTPLKTAIGNARVVFLGEQTHGDGACFAAKSRLIKFLHKEMGFEVLAWESGMEEMRRADEAMVAGKPVDDLHGIGLFGIWALSQQCREVLEYVRKNRNGDHPLILAGFDDQVTTHPTLTPFAKDLIAFFDAVDDKLLSPAQRSAPAAAYKWLTEAGDTKKTELPKELDTLRAMVTLIDRERPRLEAKHGKLEVAFKQRALGNVISYIERWLGGDEFKNHRDHRMADNLVWLANDYFAGKKIIIWAASMHNSRRVEPIEWVGANESYKGIHPMGDYAFDALGKDMYSIMFLAYSGRIGRPWSGAGPLAAPPTDSLDDLLHRTAKPYLFLDLKSQPEDSWLRQPLIARPLGYANMKHIWPTSFDGVVFTDRMYPSTRIGVEPEDARPPVAKP